MNRLIRSMMLGGSAALALAAGTARAHDVDHPRPPLAETAPLRFAHDRDGDRLEMHREYGEYEAARERFYRGWHGDRLERARFERWRALRRAELDRRWAHEHYRW